jgi:hypothetical protein
LVVVVVVVIMLLLLLFQRLSSGLSVVFGCFCLPPCLVTATGGGLHFCIADISYYNYDDDDDD